MNPEVFKYLISIGFVLVTFYLSFIGMKKTKCIKSFSIGNKDMNPFLIGITMAASISSTATFVINPGFVYTHGLSAYIHFGVAASLGMLFAFVIIAKGFRAQGESSGALTIPSWIQHRYGNRGLSLFFAILNLLSVTFVVLILVGCSFLISNMFGISQFWSLTFGLLFVFSYVLVGGTYAHAYTNTFQGVLMIFIALFLFGHGIWNLEVPFIQAMNSVSNNFGALVNPESNLYYDFFSVFICGFIITFALMLQPHILTKILYVKEDKDLKKFIITTFVVSLCFGLMLFIGFFAKFSGLEGIAQDQVVAEYIKATFGEVGLGGYLFTFINITLLAAGFSTLDGILVALSSMVVNDLYLPFSKNNNSPEKALVLSRYVLVVIGLISYLIALNPPKLVGLFAQKGVYGIAAASIVPILVGVLWPKNVRTKIIFAASISGLVSHLFLNLFGGIINPAVSATYGIFISTGVFFLGELTLSFKGKAEVNTTSKNLV